MNFISDKSIKKLLHSWYTMLKHRHFSKAEEIKTTLLYDIHRHPNPHIGFGHGIHFCLGAPLARLAACTAIKIFIERYEALELLSYVPMTSSSMYGLKELKLRVTPRS
nr:cytochrome P450 [Bacillus subtilis]